MTSTQHADNQAALAILNATGVPVLKAAILAKEALAANRGSIRRARRCLAAGSEALRQQERTVTFEKAVEAALEARKDRRTRTVYDFRYFTRRFMKRCVGLARRRVRSITPQECAEYIETAFDTPRQRQKPRLILSGVFSSAMKRGWCDANPVSKVEAPRVVEQPVPILTPQEIEQITTTASIYQGGSCAAAYFCELPPELFPQFCGAAAGDRTPGCFAAPHALCGPARGARSCPVLGSVK